MISLDFLTYRNRPVKNLNFQIELANCQFLYSETFDFGSLGTISVQALGQAAEQYARLTDFTCAPQLATLLFAVTEQPRALDWYFPITNTFGEQEAAEFDSFRQTIAEHPNFDLRFFAEDRRDITSLLPIEVRHLIAGHLAEIFFYRPTLFAQFFLLPKHIYLYTSPKAYAADGGQAGGQFHSDRECLQIVVSRLFEGYNGDTPGVCPFLHEFGHLLDFFNAGSGRLSRESSGFLPGLRPSDGSVYSVRARELFIRGKKIERDRYLARYLGYAAPTPTLEAQSGQADPLPIGHPYVFQNDTEFIAGYFEMFFRNPNYFASLNPDLFDSLVELFGWDPRTAWPKDFPFYVEGNRQFYLSGERPWQPGLTLPK